MHPRTFDSMLGMAAAAAANAAATPAAAAFYARNVPLHPGDRDLPQEKLEAFVVDPLGSKSTVERICEHVFPERRGLLYLLSVGNWSGY